MSSNPKNPFENDHKPDAKPTSQTWLQKAKESKNQKPQDPQYKSSIDPPALVPSHMNGSDNTSPKPPLPPKRSNLSPVQVESKPISPSANKDSGDTTRSNITMTQQSIADDAIPVNRPLPPIPKPSLPAPSPSFKVQNPMKQAAVEPGRTSNLQAKDSRPNPASSYADNESKRPDPPSMHLNYPDDQANVDSYSSVMSQSPIHSHENTSQKDNAYGIPKSFHHINENIEPGNLIYSKVSFSEGYWLIALACHIGQFSILLTVGQRTLPVGAFYLLLIMVIVVAVLLLYARFCVTRKPRHFEFWSKEQMQPDDETDAVPPKAIYSLVVAVLLEGLIFAIYAVLTSGTIGTLDSTGFFTSDTTLQALRFASITLLALYRIIRPANRVDPMRTFMELEVVSVCWDALDGSAIVELVDGRELAPDTLIASQFLILFWYVSVGVRMAVMISVLLPPTDFAYKTFAYQPLQMAEQPTVDRTMQGLRIRSNLILVMACAEFYAAGLRIMLWAQGYLDTLQQDLALKNLLFLSSVYSAYSMRNNTIKRDWNDRDLGFGILLPTRPTQLRIFRWIFVVSYLTQGVLLSVILTLVTPSSNPWIVNVVTDVIFVLIFLCYCSHAHIQHADTSRYRFLLPKKSYVMFPAKMAFVVSTLMMINLYSVRIPTIYYHAHDMSDSNTGTLVNYNSALLIVNFSVIVIGSMSMYWSIAFMLFKKEFTSSPGNYNAIHDPTISMVSTSIQIEAALDVLSCTTLMALATENLPASIDGACVMFSLLELFNAYQSFGLQIILSGGHDDTPADLVRWKAFLRSFRFFVDLGTFVLRVDLWVQYNALSSVFLIKNLYNLLNTIAQVERSYGIDRYPQTVLFNEFVPPNEWYAMSKDLWRVATRTDGAQSKIVARAQYS